MPGTVQATVLEFKSCSSHPSAESLKVSMGKRHYQTKDKGDFSFPITKLGEDLVLAFVDESGNEMARVDIRLVQIIEKGCWDEVFPLNGFGHVHMKLQVLLNEEDRNRIRVMRESKMKKKQETNPTNINLRLLQSVGSVETSNSEKASDSKKRLVQTDNVSPSLEDPLSQAGPPFADSRYTYQKEDGNTQKIQSRPSQLRNSQLSDVHQGAVLQQAEPSIPNKNIPVSRRSKDDLSRVSQNQSLLKTTPSKVKKMISAFEKTQVQEVKSLRKSMSVPSQLNQAGKGNLRELQESTVSTEPDEQNLRKYEDHLISQNLHQSTSRVNHEPDIVPSKTEQAEAPKEFESSFEPKPFIEKSSPDECSSGTAPRETIVKNSEISVQNVLPKNSTLETAKRRVDAEEFRVAQSANMSADRMDPSEPNMLEKHDLKQGKFEMENDQNKFRNQPESGAGSSPHESSKKLVGQVIKVVVILGFGVLVLLTRQKEPRKKSREVKVDLFTVPDYYVE